jgi:hypothetical protein
MDNNIVPTTTIHRGDLELVMVEMRKGCISVGILIKDGTMAQFPLDWDDQDPHTAVLIARDLAVGLKSPEDALKMPHYTMLYPIQRK